MHFKNLIKKEKNSKENLTVEEKLRQFWDDYCDAGYELMIATRPGLEIADALKKVLDSCPGGTVLDAGCGTGMMFERILTKTVAAKLIAGDFSEKMLRKAIKTREQLNESLRNKIEIIKLNLLEDFPFPDNTFDEEIFHQVLSYIPHQKWPSVLNEAYRTTKPGGYIYISTHLEGYDFVKDVTAKQAILEIIHNPRILFYVLRMKKILERWHKFFEEGIMRYPSYEEFINYQKQAGFINIEVRAKYYKGTEIMTRAQKPKKI